MPRTNAVSGESGGLATPGSGSRESRRLIMIEHVHARTGFLPGKFSAAQAGTPLKLLQKLAVSAGSRTFPLVLFLVRPGFSASIAYH